MGKTVVMFPGQGSQYTGMGIESYDRCSKAQSCFKTAGELTGIDMEQLIFQESEQLNKTEYTQIALYVTEMAMFKDMLEQGLTYDAAIGLSLGEYSALTASGALKYEDGVRLVRNRGIYMEQEVMAGAGAMAAVLGLTAKEVDKALMEYNTRYKQTSVSNVRSEYPAVVSVANYNCPGQIVISGRKDCVIAVMKLLEEYGARRTVMLNVSGPFHSELLKGAGEKLMKDLNGISFEEIRHPYMANYTADYIDKSSSSDNIKELLAKQVYSPVYFEQSVRRLIEDGYDTYVEIGPGRTLSGFVKKIAKSMDTKVDIK